MPPSPLPSTLFFASARRTSNFLASRKARWVPHRDTHACARTHTKRERRGQRTKTSSYVVPHARRRQTRAQTHTRTQTGRHVSELLLLWPAACRSCLFISVPLRDARQGVPRPPFLSAGAAAAFHVDARCGSVPVLSLALVGLLFFRFCQGGSQWRLSTVARIVNLANVCAP